MSQFERDIFANQKLSRVKMNILKSQGTKCEIKPKVAIVAHRAFATRGGEFAIQWWITSEDKHKSTVRLQRQDSETTKTEVM